MSLIASTLLAAGPALIRMAGRFFDSDNAAAVSEQLARTVEAASGLSPAAAQNHVENAVANMPDEDVAVVMELKVKLEEIAAEREKNRFNHELGMHQQTQETIRTEAVHGTDYVKETRPKMARLSGYAGTVYILVAELLHRVAPLFNHVEDEKLITYAIAGADPLVAATLYGPLFTYMGMRTVDAFSKWKQTPGAANPIAAALTRGALK